MLLVPASEVTQMLWNPLVNAIQGLNGDGEGVYLYDAPERGAELVDAVQFGPQVPDLSLGRRRVSGSDSGQCE